MRSMIHILSLTIAFSLSHHALASDKQLQAMKQAYVKVESLTAAFKQSVKSMTLGRTKESEGRIYIKRPNMFRWETLSPDPSILTSNGVRFWYYTPPFRDDEKGQVTIKAAKDVPSQMAIDLLSGRADLQKTFSSKKADAGHYLLTPRKPRGDLRLVELFLENQTNLVYKLVLHGNSGTETTLVLIKPELNPPLDKSMFSFMIPKGTEVIR